MSLIYSIDLIGTVVFAISGTLAASRHRIDIFGATFIGFVTAIGGGSLRDIFLNIRPVWVEDGNYIIAIVVGVGISLVFNKHLYKLAKTLTLFDALGIGFFTVVGVEKSLNHESSHIAAVLLGMFSASMGGVIRDVLLNQTPLILRKEIYATACIIGATCFVLLANINTPPGINAFVSASTIVIIRLVSIRFNFSLPSIKKQ